MTLTILFDLDDTLLRTNMEVFLPSYFDGIETTYADFGAEDIIREHNHTAVRAMIDNRDPGRRLKDVFNQNFYPAIGTTAAAAKERNESFYREIHPSYERLTDQKPEAVELIAWCRAQGFTLAVATNPLFPREATLQRIHWAGLKPADFQFFTTYEDFHFTKPSILYYAECLGRLGWPKGPIVMVGDNITHDLLPMEAMGFATFWITDEPLPADRTGGSLAEVKTWLEEQRNSAVHLVESYEVLNAILRSTPAVLDGWLQNLAKEDFQKSPAPDEWSLTEIFWHLADMEKDVYLPQWQQLKNDPKQPVTPPNTSGWAESREYRSRSPMEALRQFYEARMESLALIQAFADSDRMGEIIRHTVFSELSIEEMVQFSARHDRIHLCQCYDLIKDNI
ncbi:MAG: DinB family protein [Chloroflexota bacterium]|nr:DinB family protein [Chloroflexota bacterium]